jgi:hypothetical protein
VGLNGFEPITEKKGKVAVIDFLKVNDWISVDEYDEVESITEEEFDESITLVD